MAYIEPVEENVGTSHPIYGGILTDLMELPVNTSFHVANGCWKGIITEDKGRKCMLVLGTDRPIPINDSNRYSLWLEDIQMSDIRI